MQEARNYLDENPTMAKVKKSQDTISLGTATSRPHPPLAASGSIEQFGRCIYEVQLKKPEGGRDATLHIFVEPADEESDPDLFVSNLCHHPSAADSEWSSQGGGSDHIIIPPQDPFFSYGKYWISVVAPSGPAIFNITIWAVEGKFESVDQLSMRRTDQSVFTAIQNLNKRQRGNMVQAAASVRAAATQVTNRGIFSSLTPVLFLFSSFTCPPSCLQQSIESDRLAWLAWALLTSSHGNLVLNSASVNSKTSRKI